MRTLLHRALAPVLAPLALCSLVACSGGEPNAAAGDDVRPGLPFLPRRRNRRAAKS
jgi:hypothetical protein